MSSIVATIAAAIFLSVYARGDVSNSYLPAYPDSKGSGPVWSGPLAVPTVLSDGTIAETAEVAATRAAHVAAVETARASDPDMGWDDGEYDPQKYGDHLYGVVPHKEDLLQIIQNYQILAKTGAVPAPVYGVPITDMKSVSQAMSDASAGGAVYGAPLTGSGGVSTNAVYGAPLTGSGGVSTNAVYGAPETGSGGVSTNAVYGAPETGSGAVSTNAVYGAPETGSGAVSTSAVYGAPSQADVGSGYGTLEQNMPYQGPLAMLQLLASGYLEDTPEVVAARNTHLKALQEAQAAEDLWRAKTATAGSAQGHPWG